VTGFESYVDAWRRRWERARAADLAAAVEARRTAARLATILRDRYHARRVVLVGSAARGTFRVGSDLDLAIEGVADERFFQAGAELESEAGGLRVDLVPIESATPAFLKDLAAEGIVLHDDRR
jgi:predicted nucleotidyltransferase